MTCTQQGATGSFGCAAEGLLSGANDWSINYPDCRIIPSHSPDKDSRLVLDPLKIMPLISGLLARSLF